MTQTLTTERLREIASSPSFSANPLSHEVKYMARELLANREAQPVGFYTTVSGRKGVVWHNGAPEDDTAIYTAPPAPAVPGAAKVGEMPFLGSSEPVYVKGWNACRAAMLAQPQSEPQNIPNNIPDGLAAAVNRLLDCDGTRGHFSATRCSDAREEVERLLAQPVSQDYKLNSPETPDGCQWTFDEHDSKWDSGCGDAWMFCDGGPTENGVKFCQSCGKPVLLAAAPEGK